MDREGWIFEVDQQAAIAFSRLEVMERAYTNGSTPDVCIADALRAIATQLAHANSIAAADLYMTHLDNDDTYQEG